MGWDELPEKNPKKKLRENLNRRARIAFEQTGWVVATTQTYNPFTGRSNDLFGFADLMMFIPGTGCCVLVQVCAMGDRNKRLRKILENKTAYQWLVDNRNHHIWVDAWRKLKRDVYDKKGRTITREIWTHDVRIVDEKDFDPCHINSYRDAEYPDAELEQSREVECVPTISGSTNVSDDARLTTLRLVKSFTIQPTGKD